MTTSHTTLVPGGEFSVEEVLASREVGDRILLGGAPTGQDTNQDRQGRFHHRKFRHEHTTGWLERTQPGADAPARGFLEAFAEHLRTDPSRAACYRVTAAGKRLESRPATYRELADRAWRAWRGLEARGLRPGDRFLLCVTSPDDLLASLLASMAAGFVPVPLPPMAELGTPAAFMDRIRSVAADCAPKLVVADLRSKQRLEAEGLDGLAVVDPEELESRPGLSLPPGRSFPVKPHSEIAFLQYTSGSTGSPRGVVVTHANLAANCHAIGVGSGVDAEDRVVTWLPLHHDMGLIGGLLFPLYCRIPTYVMSPVTFVMSPATWLRAIHLFRATYSVAPNFAYRLCLKKIPDRELAELDLSCWRRAFNGAEPIDPDTVRGFAERFAACGFRAASLYPVYGLAEATLAASMPLPDQEPTVDTVDRRRLADSGRAVPADPADPDAVSFVSVGQPSPGQRVRIVDADNREPLPERRVGEILVAGPSVTPGYFGQPDEPREVLATGDLGYVADGQLYVIDRLKDLIIVGGQNFAPSDLEREALVPGVREGRVVAFSTPGESGTERLHLAAELDLRAWRTQDAIRQQMEEAVRQRFGLAVEDVSLVRPGTLPRTTSGKVRRRECRDLYLSGALTSGVDLRSRLTGAAKQTLQQAAQLVVRPAVAPTPSSNPG